MAANHGKSAPSCGTKGTGQDQQPAGTRILLFLVHSLVHLFWFSMMAEDHWVPFWGTLQLQQFTLPSDTGADAPGYGGAGSLAGATLDGLTCVVV